MICQMGSESNSIIMDFFSGSATTAHAVMQLNAEDGGHRKFIMVQLPEPCDESSEAYKAGYKNICEIGKERIRRAGEKIREENPLTTQNLDTGFRVLKLDDSNMKDVYYAAEDYDQKNLADMISNIKEDRTDLDLLFGCLLDWGLPLSMPYQSEQIDGCTVHTYNDGDLIACFDKNISENVVKEIAKRKPLRAVFRDSSFADSPSKINVFEIFKLYMPEDAISGGRSKGCSGRLRRTAVFDAILHDGQRNRSPTGAIRTRRFHRLAQRAHCTGIIRRNHFGTSAKGTALQSD